MIIHNGKEIPTLEFPQDPDSSRLYTFIMRPDVWHADTIYYDRKSIIIPTVFNGFYYLAQSGGKSEATEPAFPCKKGAVVADGCVEWVAVSYDMYLRPGKNIKTADWSADHADVTIGTATTDADKTEALISTIPASVDKVTITIHFTYDDGTYDDRSFIIPVAQL